LPTSVHGPGYPFATLADVTLRNLAITLKNRGRTSPRIQHPGHQVLLVNGGFRTSEFHVAPVKKDAAHRCCSMDAVSVVAGPATIVAAKQLSSLSDGLRERPLSLSWHCPAVLTKVKVQSRPVVHRESRRRKERVDSSHSREAGDWLLTVCC
jgi:hypothetical protein